MKAFWKSITIWFNGVAAGLVTVLPELAEQLPLMKSYMPDDYYKWAFLVVTVGNVIIRARTKTAIGMRDAL